MSLSWEHKCKGCGKEFDSFSPKQDLCYRCECKKIEVLFPDFKTEAARDLMYIATVDVSTRDNAHLLQKAAKELEKSKRLLEEAKKICFRVYDEEIPLFSSDRLKGLHKECKDFIEKL